jgi:organic hydroperoxide reductase OsmC/OhrA
MDAVGTVTLLLQSDFRFEVDFGLAEVPRLSTDAMPPLGRGSGPDSEMLLMAAVGNCLSASLAFSLRKFKNDDVPIRTTVDATLARDERGRLRVRSLAVDIHLGVPANTLRLVDRAVAQYEDFCTVTQSVRVAIPVTVRVLDSSGAEISA